MRVLHVLEAVEGGTARHVVDVVESVAGTEHVVAMPRERRVGVTDHAAAPAIVAAGGRVATVDMHRRPTAVVNLRAIRRIRQLIRSFEPQVVHGHSSIGGVLARVAAIGSGLPVVYTPNGLAPGRLAVFVERVLARRTAVVVAVSGSEADDVVAAGIAPAERVTVVPNGVRVPGPEATDLRAVLGVPDGTPLLGFVGRLAPQKAPEVFLEAAERLGLARADLHVVVIGDGPLRDELEDRLRGGPLGQRLHWLPQLPGAAAYLGDLDVLALPSRFEGAPYVPMEAMRAGVAVVLTDATGNRDVVTHGVDGMLVPIDDPGALATAIAGLLDDPATRAAMGSAAAATVAERFSLGATTARLADVYASVAATGRPTRRDAVS